MARTDSAAAISGVLSSALAALIGSCAGPSGTVDGIGAAGPARVAGLYARHCAACHGEDGGGDGPASPHLFPVPRDFGGGRFRLVSTRNGAPTDADLVACVERGMPGAAMPSFAWLPADDLVQLARHVRELAIARMARDLAARYEQAGRPLSEADARDVAVSRLTPGEVVEVPPSVEPTGEVLKRGRVVYLERCAACHGADGEGQKPDRSWAAFEGLYWARDLRDGPLKGGADRSALGHRILAGMPGVAMPPARFVDPNDAAALIAYLRSILPADADRRGVQRRQRLRVSEVTEVHDDPAHVVWDGAKAIDVALMALACREDCVDRAELRAVHDGSRIAIRVSWRDPTRDDRAIGGASRWADQCALQLSAEELPPLFGMGAHETRVNIWHWAAFRSRDITGALDLLEGGRVDVAPANAPGLVSPAEHADEVESRGLTGPRTVAEAVIKARPVYRDGRWYVVFVRALGGDGAEVLDGLVLRPGDTVQVGCAVWNGSAEDVGARKAISIWHELVLQ